MSQNGKGSKPRPKSVDQNTWSKNWDNIFGSKSKEKKNDKRRKNSD